MRTFPPLPSVPPTDTSLPRIKFDPKRTIMVGDRLATDILFGKRGGVSTLLVLTGSTKLEDLEGLPVGEEPDYVSSSVGDILSCQ
jgi:4-nitrophenyl phosphatase